MHSIRQSVRGGNLGKKEKGNKGWEACQKDVASIGSGVEEVLGVGERGEKRVEGEERRVGDGSGAIGEVIGQRVEKPEAAGEGVELLPVAVPEIGDESDVAEQRRQPRRRGGRGGRGGAGEQLLVFVLHAIGNGGSTSALTASLLEGILCGSTSACTAAAASHSIKLN